jgi:hypothetical protein
LGAKFARFTIDRLVIALQAFDPDARVTLRIGEGAALR